MPHCNRKFASNMKKKYENLQDIYRAPKERTEDPDYVLKMPPELENQFRQNQIRAAFLGILSFALLFSLIAVMTREMRVAPAPLLAPLSKKSAYIPHYTLPSDELWVMSYERAAQSVSPEEVHGDRPISTKWLKNVAYHSIMGEQALAVKEYKKAALHLEKALTIFPEMQGVNGALGTAYLRQKNFGAAIAPLQAALQEEETFPIVSNLGVALLATQQLEQSENYLLRALARQPEHPGCYKNLALLYQEIESPKQAILYFENYLSRCPDDFSTTERYSEYLLRLGQRNRATDFLRKACLQETADALPLYLLLAKVEAAATNEVQAIEALNNITRYISPNLAIVQLNMNDFDTIRDTEAFQNLLHQIELADVTLENQN